LLLLRPVLAFRCGCTQHLLHVLLELQPRDQHTVLTADTFDPNVHPHADDFHFIRAAWMRLLHLNNIPKSERLAFHSTRLPAPLSYMTPASSCCWICRARLPGQSVFITAQAHSPAPSMRRSPGSRHARHGSPA